MNVMDSESADGDPSYAYKSSLLGAPFEFRLAMDALEWRKGTYKGRTPYDRIRRIRLSFAAHSTGDVSVGGPKGWRTRMVATSRCPSTAPPGRTRRGFR